ncbi:DnaB-like dsDNA helicase [Gordonia phage VanLee]|uniref:DnaB-like dsDNA helicase n=1 Tax=Gordonia phage VanLee TaxID=2845816 RepID=A0A8F2IFD0_9CAUD|nr:DnaB-like dsDNA helicase [Gordonia phage VanLee]QWS68163.1 DnaB-like dsDNA helicase [Gordonia phage VanLee]
MNELFDVDSERHLLATVVEYPHTAEKLTVPTSAFYLPTHRVIAEVIHQALAAGEPFKRVDEPDAPGVDSSVIMARATALAGGGARADAVRTAMVEMLSQGMPASMSYHAERVLSLARARSLVAIGTRLRQHAEETPEDLDRAVAEALGDLSTEDQVNMTGQEPERISSLRQVDTNYDWLVPELLEATDRLMITGFEGTGKSVLMAQFAACLAAGIHPFLFEPLGTPKSVLVVDAENSRRQVTRRYNNLISRVEGRVRDHSMAPTPWDETLGFLLRPEGLHLNEPTHLRLLENMIVTQRPDVVVAGPLYRLHSSDTKDEQAAKELINIIDRLRVKYHFAFICEAHVNHGSPGQNRALRPTGSSVFLRWPEFGIGLRPTAEAEGQEHPDRVNVVHWRGGRDERFWPRTLQHAVAMPWGVADEKYYADHRARGLI